MNTFYKTPICLFIFLNLATVFSQESSTTHDSIVSWIEKAKDKKLSLEDRKELLLKAFKQTHKEQNDSLRNEQYFLLTIGYKKIRDKPMQRRANKNALLLSRKLNDSFKIARCYWRFGDLNKNINRSDSAYFYYNKAFIIFSLTNKKYNSAKVLLNISLIKKNIKDYIGSELFIIKAIKIFKDVGTNYDLFKCYNHLGILFKNLKQYKQALKYHNIASKYLDKNNSSYISLCNNLNNTGLIYRYQENYKQAIDNFSKALAIDSLFLKSPRQYSIVLDNLAYTKLLSNDTIGIEKLFYKSLHIKDSINFLSGIGISKLHLAEYYLDIHNDSLKSFKLAIEAKNQLKKIKSYKLLLESYDLLAKIDPKNSSKYLRRYITISDSLLLEERRTRDKFTRIEYETGELEEQFNTVKSEAAQLEGEAAEYKRRNKRVYRILWWLGGIIVLVSTVLTIRYYQRTLRNKYEKVVLQQQLLRSQMNPHFLFNTLNTILYTNDTKPEKTKQYVLKLSQLLRTTLENSREEFVPLQDEIEAIDNYLNLQSNFSEKFDFKLTITDKLETEFTYVPPMLIQPFVENAIIHGIMNTKTRGLISLDFSLKSKELVSCTITDNGIGYSKNSHEGKSNLKTHKSISGDIVKERLVIYNKQNRTNASLNIEDIADVNGNTTGTKVTLNLPSYEI